MTPGIRRLLKNPVSFLTDVPENPACISTRIRLSRNIAGLPFPDAASPEEAQKVIAEVKKAAAKTTALSGRSALFFPLSDLNAIDREFLMERRMASYDFIHQENPAALLIRGTDERCSLMINEEDQLRLQYFLPGFQLDAAWNQINRLDDELSSVLDYACDDKLGYLTACPTNVGTGMRASVMLHLPGLVLTGQINSTIHGVSKLGMAVRGIFGEGSDNRGNLYQVSNQVTLGESEGSIIQGLKPVISQLAFHELQARQHLLERDRNALYDYVGRAYGVLSHSYKLSSEEALKCLSGIRLGADLGLFKSVDTHLVNELFLELNPAHLQERAGGELLPNEREICRAELFRKKLKG